MSMTPTGIDQLVSLLKGLGIDTADMSLNEAQHRYSSHRTGDTSCVILSGTAAYDRSQMLLMPL
eukprot:2502072-Amphidinium_carterae.1